MGGPGWLSGSWDLCDDVCSVTPSGYPLSQEMRLSSKQVNVQHRLYLWQTARGTSLEAIAHVYFLRIKSNGVYAMVAGKKNGALIVESLRVDGDPILAEYLLCPHYGVQGTKSGVVQIDALRRHAFENAFFMSVGSS